MEFLIGLLIVNLVLSYVVGWVSQQRGRSFWLGFLLSAFLSPIFGVLILIALPGGSTVKSAGTMSNGDSVAAREWSKVRNSLDVRDYDDFVQVMPGTEEAVLATKQKRMIQDWQAIDQMDGRAIEEFMGRSSFAALSEEIRRVVERSAPQSASCAELLRQVIAREQLEWGRREQEAAQRRQEEEVRAAAAAARAVEDWKRYEKGMLFARWAFATLIAALLAAISVTVYLRAQKAERMLAQMDENMVVLPSGTFTMGSPPTEWGRGLGEGPQRAVRIDYQLAVGKYEVTFAEWDVCVADGGCYGQLEDLSWGRASRPVMNVSRYDAKRYIAWLNKTTRLRGRTDAFRLLTEAEWEYAARAGSQELWSFGDEGRRLGDFAVFKGNSGDQTQPVGSKTANAFGLHDMYGNVSEWIEDNYVHTYYTAPTDGSAVKIEETFPLYVIRGGSFRDGPDKLRSADRSADTAGTTRSDIGFRIARTLPAE